MNNGQRTTDNGQRTTDNGQRTMDNGQWTNNGLFNDYTWQGLASKLRVHTSHENSTVSRRRVTSCYYFACKTQKYVLLLCTLKPKVESCEPSRLRSYQWVSHHDCVHIDDLASLHNCIHTENQQSYDSVSRHAIPGKGQPPRRIS